MSRIRRKEVEGGYDFEEAWLGEFIVWPQAPRYVVAAGWISPEPGSNLQSFPPPSPFADGDLLLSFARLGARGEPSTKSTEKWVSKYGLLERADEDIRSDQLLGDGRVNQKPMRISEFTREVFRVRDLMSLYTQIRDMDYAAVDSRCIEPGSATDEQLSAWVAPLLSERYSRTAYEVALDVAQNGVLAPNPVISLADWFLAHSLSDSLSRVHIKVVPGFRPFAGVKEGDFASLMGAATTQYKPGHSWHCPDLLSAIYLQLFLLVTKNTPMRFCEACQTPLPAKPKHKRFCNDTCRSNGRKK